MSIKYCNTTMIIRMKTIVYFQQMYAYFLVGSLSYAAVVSTVDTKTAAAYMHASAPVERTTTTKKYESRRNTPLA